MEKVFLNKFFVLKKEIGPINTNCYLIYGLNSNNAALVDFGYFDIDVVNQIKNKNLNVTHILLTHGHFDHFMGVEKWLNEVSSESVVLISETDFKLLNNSEHNASFFFHCPIKLNSKKVHPIKNNFEFQVGLDLKFKVLSTPGHTAGSCSFLLNNEILFTGDALFKNGIGRTDLFSASEKSTVETMHFFKTLNPNLKIFPGHGELTTLKNEFLNNSVFKGLR